MKIISIKHGSQAEKLGICANDLILSINGQPARDMIDLMFHSSEEQVTLTILRHTTKFDIVLSGYEDFGFDVEDMRIMSCGNKCIFCFVDQNPPGMRSGIYIKDEDYRLSFLHGSYVTLTNLRENDLQRIKKQNLSPLYVSVHATDSGIRKRLLGLKNDDHLLEKIDHLIGSGIKVHTQIVVCPGINDRNILLKSINDLHSRFPGILSCAIVPVGLTKHRGNLCFLQDVDSACARVTIECVDKLHDSFISTTGYGFVYCADEWYIRAGYNVPDMNYYDDFPQLENGVGMLRRFLHKVSGIEKRLKGKTWYSGRYVLVTGTSMAPYIEDFALRLSRTTQLQIRTLQVHNEFYGESVTVSGLLTGADILSSLKGISSDEIVILPPNCINESGVFLDNLSPEDIATALGVRVIEGSYDPIETFLKIQREV